MANADTNENQPELNGAKNKPQGAGNVQPSPEQAEKKEHGPPKMAAIAEADLEQLKKEAAEYKDKYLRVLAESENARKRLQKERQELIQYAVQNMVADFLNPIDHFENALKFTGQASDEVKHWALGFQMILNQFKDVLTSNGVAAFDSVGTNFDPHLHEAVEMEATSEMPPGTVVAESLRGYKMGDRVIRPARVKVAKNPAPQAAPNEINKNETNNSPENEEKSNPAQQKS